MQLNLQAPREGEHDPAREYQPLTKSTAFGFCQPQGLRPALEVNEDILPLQSPLVWHWGSEDNGAAWCRIIFTASELQVLCLRACAMGPPPEPPAPRF